MKLSAKIINKRLHSHIGYTVNGKIPAAKNRFFKIYLEFKHIGKVCCYLYFPKIYIYFSDK